MKCWVRNARRGNLRQVHLHLLVAALLCGGALAQETTFHSESNVVMIPALVKSAKGEVVYGLGAKDFVVEDDGVEQPVRLDDVTEGSQIYLVVAIQRGRRANYEFPRIRGLSAMLDPLLESGAGRIAIVEFDSQVELVQDFSGNSERVAGNLKSLQAGDGGAAIVDAVDFSVKLLQKSPPQRQRVLLLISETRDHGSQTKVADVVAEIGQSSAAVYALAFSPTRSNMLDTMQGNNLNEMHEGLDILGLGYLAVQAMRKNTPQAVASMSGGEYELFTTRKHFEARMIDFSNHLRSRYLLSIEPKDPHPGLHRLTVRLRDPQDRMVLARSRYWAAGADK